MDVPKREQYALAELMVKHLLTDPDPPSEFAISVLEEFGLIHDDETPDIPVVPFTPEELEGVEP